MPPMQGQAGAFIGALFSSGYIYAIAGLQVVGGLCLLIGRFVPLGLTLLVPVIINIILYHIFLDPGGRGMACVIRTTADAADGNGSTWVEQFLLDGKSDKSDGEATS